MIGTLLLNRYELLEKIGEGGMGIVYKAKCTLLNRFVAIKILKTELIDCEDFITRFKREANSIASLSHPNIVSVYDAGSENNINFIVMEYINGKTLKQLLKENLSLSPLQTLDIAFQIATALECAHKNKIIHRDIKPDNILITEDNIVKLTDFGIAKVADSVTLTNSNKIIGSVHYISPEQAKGKLVDYRTDIYSLGIVMYEMITGQVPYNAENSISVVMMHIQEPILEPKEINTHIPDNINQVILKTLEKEPINRFQTAKELAEILNVIKDNLNNNPTDAPTVMMDAENNFTTVENKETISETIIIKKDRNRLFGKNKKLMLAIGLIILTLIIFILGISLFKEPSQDIESNIAETTSPKVDEKKVVPSLTGQTQDNAKITISNNGFSLGNITNEYSDNIPKGLVISQSPSVNTLYEKNGKIDLVISQGEPIAQVSPQTKGNEKSKNKNSKK